MSRPARIPRFVPVLPDKDAHDRNRAHLDWVKTLPCIVCGNRADDPHHLKRLTDPDGRRDIRGMSRKSADRWSVPVCRKDHRWAESTGNDEAQFASIAIDARALAMALWRVSGDTEAGIRTVEKTRAEAALTLRKLTPA